VPFSTLFSGVVLLNLFYWCSNQQIIQRAFAARSLKEGQQGVLLAALFKILAPLILVIPGIAAFHLFAGEDLKGVNAYGRLVREVLPTPLAGFFAAAVVGAVLSSFNSVLNSTATLFSLGLSRHVLHPGATDMQTIRAGQVFGLAVAVGAMLGAPLLAGQKSIFDYLQKMNGLYFIPLFSVMLVGMFTRRVPAEAANVALVGGFAVIAAGYFVPPLTEYVNRLHQFHFLGLTFVALIAVMAVIGRLRPRAEPWRQKEAHAVDLTPWRFARPVGLVLVAAVIALYIAFADLRGAGILAGP
jgi:SSS family solute:Na+ symporter